MVFKGLKDKFKHKSGTKYLQKELKRPPLALARKPGIHSLGIIADLESFGQDDRFFDLVEDLGLKSNTVKIIGYRAYYQEHHFEWRSKECGFEFEGGSDSRIF